MHRAFGDNNFLNKSLMLAFQHIISMGGRRDIHLLKGIFALPFCMQLSCCYGHIML